MQPEKIGLLMGNRGKLGPILHLLPQPCASGKPWITCITKENGIPLPKANVTYTKLFILDEVTAFAAGHRPCGQCQSQRYNLFVAALEKIGRLKGKTVDDILYEDRYDENRLKRTYLCALDKLPSGVMVRLPGYDNPYLLLWGKLFPWTMNGYERPISASMRATVQVLTPSSIVQMFKEGFPLNVCREETIHPSVLKYL